VTRKRSFLGRCVDAACREYNGLKASGLFGRGSKLLYEGKTEESVAVLQRALELLGPRPAASEGAGNFSTRICVVTLLAQAAARAGDHELAAESVREGMALWAETKLAIPQRRTSAMLVRWEEWARSYMAWLEAEEKR
jgi:hypothetical protein